MSNETFEDDLIDVLDRISAMRLQEGKTTRCRNYFTYFVNRSCRKAMVDWCFIVVDSFDLSRETVAIAMSILDRYLSSGKGKSVEALQKKNKFQLATITSFYMAVKIHEPVKLGIGMLIKLCRGFYKESDVIATEQDILFSLDWRVCVSSATPMEYVRHFLEMLPEWMDVADVILENATKHTDCATKDIYFSTCRASTVGVACLAGALNDVYSLSSFEKEVIWRKLNRKLDFDIQSNEVRKIERQLLAKSTCCDPKRQSLASLPRSRSVGSANEQPSSPVCVMH